MKVTDDRVPPPPMTLLEAEAMVIKVMKEREPDTVLDPDNVRFIAELLIELFRHGNFQMAAPSWRDDHTKD